MLRRAPLVLVVALSAATAHAGDRDTAEARALYEKGKLEFETRDFAHAYDHFKQSFRLTHAPALLFNMASALQGMERPHDAADELRSYLELQPGDPDKEEIQKRIAALEVEQRILDRDRKSAGTVAVKPPPEVVASPPPLATSVPIAVEQQREPLIAPPKADPPATAAPSSHRALYIGIAVAAILVVAAGGVAIAAANPSTPAPSPSTIGTWTVTR